MATIDCYEAVGELDEAIRSCIRPGQNYYALGGIATSAIRHDATEYDHSQKRVEPITDAAEPIDRDNGTRRDVDILFDYVLSEGEGEEIVSTLKGATDLVVSVFGFDQRQEGQSGANRLAKTLGDWTSRRTIDEHGIIRYELFPLEQAVQPESFDPWTLVLPKDRGMLSVFSPAAHMLAYRMRSISGVRYKDREKLDEMTDRVMAMPEFRDQIINGIYKEWLDFALAIYRLQDGKVNLGDSLISDGVTELDLNVFGFKGRALGAFESNETIIKLAQSPMGEKLLSPFTRTK